MITYNLDLVHLCVLSRQIKIPFWWFEVAVGVRPASKYRYLGLQDLKEYMLRMTFNHPEGQDSEPYYGCALELTKKLHFYAGTAETDEQIKLVVSHLPTFYVPAGDIIMEKKHAKEKPDWLKQHQRLLRIHNSEKLAKLPFCDTTEQLWGLLGHNFAEYPIYDTYTEATLDKLVELADDLETLKQVFDRSSVWHRSKLASIRKMVALGKPVVKVT